MRAIGTLPGKAIGLSIAPDGAKKKMDYLATDLRPLTGSWRTQRLLGSEKMWVHGSSQDGSATRMAANRDICRIFPIKKSRRLFNQQDLNIFYQPEKFALKAKSAIILRQLRP